MFNLILIILFSIVFLIVFVKFFRWGVNSFSNREIMDTFSFKDVCFSLLLLFWLVLITNGVYKLIYYRDKILTQEMLAALSELHVNIDALIKNLPIFIIMLLVVIFIILIIPIICLIYFNKHKKFFET